VTARYGIEPAQVPDFIALRGDPSDGIPGAKGVGEKTAAELLHRHGTLEAALAAPVRERPAIRRALIDQADELRMFRDLATLRVVAVQRPPDAPTDSRRGARAVRELGMNRLAERLEKAAAGADAAGGAATA
jgi:DNA polymerase-1